MIVSFTHSTILFRGFCDDCGTECLYKDGSKEAATPAEIVARPEWPWGGGDYCLPKEGLFSVEGKHICRECVNANYLLDVECGTISKKG